MWSAWPPRAWSPGHSRRHQTLWKPRHLILKVTHWMDLAQHVSGARIVEVMADLSTVLPVRYKPPGTVQTFGQTNAPNPAEKTATEPLVQPTPGVEAEGRALPNGTPVQVRSEDFASILLRFDTGARGAFIVSQMSAGRKNRL